MDIQPDIDGDDGRCRHARDKVRYLLDVLENDGYLVEEGKRWRFRSPLLREYWLRRVAPPESANE
jgi:hypothetical protein